MNILNKITIKHLLLNKKRTIVSIIGILLSTALMVGIGLIFSSIREYMIEETISYTGEYHAHIEAVDYEKLKLLDNNSKINNYFFIQTLGYAKYEKSKNEYKPYFRLMFFDEKALETLRVLEGRLPANDTEIVLSNHIFSQGEGYYEVGDSITLEYGDRYDENNQKIEEDLRYHQNEIVKPLAKKTYQIVGIVERSVYEDYISPGFYVITTDTKEIEKKDVDLFLIYKNPTKTIEYSQALYKQLGKEPDVDPKTEFEYYSINYNQTLLSMYGVSIYDNVEDFFSGFLILFLSIVSVACIIVIYNSFAISVMERKKYIGLLVSVGATKKQIKRSVFFEALIVGSVGIILGIASAYLGIGVTIGIISDLLKEALPNGLKLVTYPIFLIIPLVFIILTIFISAILPARRASKISPIEVIRQNDDIKITSRKVKTNFLTKKIFGIEGDIALKNMKRNKKKYRITIISLVISITVFLAFHTYLEYGRKTVKEYTGVVDFDIYIYAPGYTNENTKKVFREILSHEEVDKYTRLEEVQLDMRILRSKNYTQEYQANWTDPYETEIYGDPYVSERISIILLNEEEYSKYKKQIGLKEDKLIMYNMYEYYDYQNQSNQLKKVKIYDNDKLKIEVCDFEKLDVEKYNNVQKIPDQFYEKNCYTTLTNFYFTTKKPESVERLTNSNGTIIATEKILQNYVQEYNSFEGAYIFADEYTNLSKLLERYENIIGYSIPAEDMRLENNLVLVVEILFYGFITLITLIGVTSVFNTIHTNILLRKREFAILRSIGLTPGGFNKMICYESIFFGIKSLLYGIPLGCMLSYLITKNFSSLVETEYYISLNAILYVTIGVFTIVLLTMWYATSKIKKENILESIKKENI